MHPECPDYDLCENCEALPIPVHPPIHPMLKMKTADTVVPTVYRVGQTSLIDRASPALPASVRSESRAPTPVPEERVRTPKAVPPLPAWMALVPAMSDDESPTSETSSIKPPLPPKPEMMSNPPWASIQGLYPSQRFSDITNPFADTFAAPTGTGYQEAEESIREIDISLPSVPSHIPNPWPTNNATERQELFQLIYDFTGPSASASIISSLSDAPHRSGEQDETSMSKAPLVDLSSVESSMYTDTSKNEAQGQPTLQEPQAQVFLPHLPLPVSGDLFNSLFQHIEDVVASRTAASGDVTRAERTQENLIEENVPEPAERTSFGNFSVSMSHLLQEMENLSFVPVTRPEASSVNNSPQRAVGKAESVTESTLSREALLNSPERKRSLIERIPHSLVDLMQSFEAPKTQSPAAEIMVEPRIPLSAAFVEDVTVPDGQVFPPGAEFVKCWKLMNDSGRDWPESTELVFVAGEMLSAEKDPAALTVGLGKVAAGSEVDAWTGELKVRCSM